MPLFRRNQTNYESQDETTYGASSSTIRDDSMSSFDLDPHDPPKKEIPDVPNMDPADDELNEKAQEVIQDNLEMMRDIVMRLREDEDFAANIYSECPRLQLLLEEHPDLRPIFEDPKLVRINFEKVYRDAGGVLPEDEKNMWFFKRWWRWLMDKIAIITSHPIFRIFKIFLIIKRVLALLSPTKGIGMIRAFFAGLLFEDFEPPEGPDGEIPNIEAEQAKAQLNAAADHMSDPEVQDRMHAMLEDPETMEEEIENDKTLRDLRDSNPLCAEMMSDPETMRILVDPDNLRALGECPELIDQDFADPSGLGGLEDTDVNALEDIPEEGDEIFEDDIQDAEDDLLEEEEVEEEEEEGGGGAASAMEDVERQERDGAKAAKGKDKSRQQRQQREADGDGRVETAGLIGSLGIGALGAMGLDGLDLFGGAEDVDVAAAAEGELGGAEDLAGVEELAEEDVAVAEDELLGEEEEEEDEGGFQDDLQENFEDMEGDDDGGAARKNNNNNRSRSAGNQQQGGQGQGGEGQSGGGGGLGGAMWGAIGGAAAGAMVGGAAAFVGDSNGYLESLHGAVEDHEDEEDSDDDGDNKKGVKGGDESDKKKGGFFGKAGSILSSAVTDHIKSSTLGEVLGEDAAEQLEDDLEAHEEEFEEDEEDEDEDDKKAKEEAAKKEEEKQEKRSRRFFGRRS